LLDHGLLKDDLLPIVVLLPSTEGDFLPGIRRRHLEYGDINLPFSTAHADWVAQSVKPVVDRRFRTLAGATYAMGSSLGGQAALYLNIRHPDQFEGAACLSPCFHPGILAAVTDGQRTPLRGKKIYMDMGGDFGEDTVPLFDLLDHTTEKHAWNPGYWWLDTSLQPAVTSMCQRLDQADVDYAYQEIPGGRHNERAWSLRIDKPLRHLLGKTLKA
jgi:enterochelin esterase-like enzyme